MPLFNPGVGVDVQTDEIDDNAITLAKLAHGTADKLLGYDSSGVPSEVDRGTMVLLDTHIATGDENSYTFTPASTLHATDYSEIIAIIRGKTDGILRLSCEFNKETGNRYHTLGQHTEAGVVTEVWDVSQGEHEVLDSTLFDGVRWFAAEIHYMLMEVGDTHAFAWSKAITSLGGYQDVACLFFPTTPKGKDFTEIIIQAETSNWIEDTVIEVYGIKRS